MSEFSEEWHGYSHRHSITFTSKRKTKNSGWTPEGNVPIHFDALKGTWPGACQVPYVEARYTYQSYIIPEEDRAEKQQYRRSAARELTEKDRKKLKRASALGKLGLPHSRLGGQHRQKRRKLSSRSEDASVSDSEDTAPSPTASDLTDVNEIEPAGYRSLVMARSCKADLVDMSPIPFISSREYLQDLEPFYYRFFQHTPQTEAERLAPLEESKAEAYHLPLFVLEYPADNVYEQFFLVKPRIKDAYDPIKDLSDTIRLIMEDFVTPEQCRDIFKCNPSLEPKKRIVKKKKQQQQQQRSKLDKQGEPSQLEKDAGLGEISIGAEGEESDLLVKLDDAIWDADGDSFEMALDQFNRGMRKLKESGAMKENLSRMPGVKEAVWTRITNQAYDRTVSPRVGELRNYKAFSDEVYGELLAPFMYDIIHNSNLRPGNVFVDLGSGVGNCIVQAALATGCEAFGIELQDVPADLAELQIKEVQNRARMYGLNMGQCKSKKGDFLQDQETLEYLRRADVVLVNNYAFKAETNLGLMQLFLEVPDKCRIVSMQPFVRNRRRDLQRGGAHSILQQGKARKFGPDCVSWMPKGGTYYVGHIDRTKLQRDLKGVITGTKVKDTGKEEVSTSRDTSMEVLAEDSAVLSSPDSLGGTPPAQLTVPDSQEDKLQAGAQEKVVLVDNMYVQL